MKWQHLIFFCFVLVFQNACSTWFFDADLYPAELEPAEVGSYYEYPFEYKDNKNYYYFRITDGALPEGLSVSPSRGLLMGTPQEAGTFEFEVTLIETATSTSIIDLDCLFEGIQDNPCTNDSEAPNETDNNSSSQRDSEWFVIEVIDHNSDVTS